MPDRTTKRALTIAGALAALTGAIVLTASPALADTDVTPLAHGRIHATPALGGRVVGCVNPTQHYTGNAGPRAT